MWRTAEGDRVLRGAEWALFRAGLVVIWELIEDSDDACGLFVSGIRAFDDLQGTQKLALLALASQALHDETIAPPNLTAHTEGAVAAVFAYIRQPIEDEMDLQDDPGIAASSRFWRESVLTVYGEMESDWEESLPDAATTDASEWDILMECLEERILWDADYVLGDDFLDTDPETSRARLEALRIPRDYYLAIAPDPTEEQLGHIRRTLRELAGRPDAEEDALL